MPRKPMNPCKHGNCAKLTEGTYCVEHMVLHKEDRPSTANRGYNAKWRTARIRYLKSHPLCVRCTEKNRLTPATVVDYINPHRGDPVLFWNQRNWQTLCKPCHDKKTMTEDRYQEYKY